MKKLIYLSALIMLSACGGNPSGGSKQEELAQLKSQEKEIKSKIEKLEKELGVSDKNASSAKIILVQADKPKKEFFEHFLEIQGKIESDENIMLSSKVPAIVTGIFVKRGDEVTKGQTLIQLDNAVLLQSVNELKNGLDLANTVFEKQQRLWEQKIGTELQFLQAKNTKENLEKRLAQLYAQIDMYKIKSPINGAVDEITPKVGELANPGFPAVRVVNYDNTKILAEVSERYITKIHKGDKVFINLPDQNRELQSTIISKTKAINAGNRTFTIEIANPVKDLTIHPNMIVIVKVNDYASKDAITVPLGLVQRDETTEFVYVTEQKGKETIAKKKLVKSGVSYNGKIEILEGITPDDEVITVGYQNVTDGATIQVQQ